MAKTRAIYRPSKGDKVFDIVNITILLIFTLLILYPIVFVVNASFSDPTKIFDTPLLLTPRGFSLDGYTEILKNDDILIGFRNAVFYTFAGTLVNIAVTTLGAYPLSRSEFRGKGFFTLFFTITMFFSGGLIPTYLVNQQLGFVNTIWVMILPGALSVYNMILMRTYFQQNIPGELIESAYVDGANDMQLLWKVVLPLSTPIIAVMAMFYGVGRWNDYFNAMIYLQDRSKFPLQLVLREILVQGQFGDTSQALLDSASAQTMMLKLTLKYSVVVVSTLPVLLFYPVVAKYFEKGIMVGAIKG
ncbi:MULTISPECIES: carbohydrate ABC transporter permease [Enterococcus]|uniref:ABC transmembrane type-1 domain-containing protein n=1 Tax=Enterococcus diestrammenae TaxID=1155073 RepID=A0ABV0EYK5_9ENTE|nr:carbohydrate ABC transporter permease [Enterococcus diestrammenae]KAF1297408.1 sugar ABC transporter permease [Enterococcus diestrammenae]